jgi:hypothetical protein
MTSFDLPTNYIDNLEALLKRTKAKLKKVLALESEDNQIRRSLTPEFEAMADKTLREFSTPTTANIHTGPNVNVGDNGFELKPALIKLASFVGRHMKMRVHISNYSRDLQHFHHQRSGQGRHTTLSLPILTFGEGKAMVLRQQR